MNAFHRTTGTLSTTILGPYITEGSINHVTSVDDRISDPISDADAEGHVGLTAGPRDAVPHKAVRGVKFALLLGDCF